MSNSDSSGEADLVSLYIRVTSSLRNRLAAGEWGPGARLPTVEQLANHYGVARVTIRHALRLLADDGLVTSTRGRGTVVADSLPSLPMRASHHTAINDRLEFSSGDSVKILSRKRITDVPAHMKPVEKAAPQYMQIEKLHIHDTHPFALVDCVVDLNAYRKFPKQADKKYKILKLLLETDGTSIAKGRQEITIAHACGRTASLLRCGVAAAVVKVRSWRHDQDGMLVFGSVTLYRGDRFIFDIVEENFLHNQASPLMIPKFRDPAA